MSMTLYLWKAPVVNDPEEAEALLKPYYDRQDDSAFESSPDTAEVAKQLLQQFPDAENGPWADSPPEANARLLELSIRWGADSAVISAITELARRHELILYDPQGPDVILPGDEVAPGPAPPLKLVDYLKFLPFGLLAAGIFWLGWRIEVPVLNWILMIAGGFLFSVVLFLYYIFLSQPKDPTS